MSECKVCGDEFAMPHRITSIPRSRVYGKLDFDLHKLNDLVPICYRCSDKSSDLSPLRPITPSTQPNSELESDFELTWEEFLNLPDLDRRMQQWTYKGRPLTREKILEFVETEKHLEQYESQWDANQKEDTRRRITDLDNAILVARAKNSTVSIQLDYVRDLRWELQYCRKSGREEGVERAQRALKEYERVADSQRNEGSMADESPQ